GPIVGGCGLMKTNHHPRSQPLAGGVVATALGLLALLALASVRAQPPAGNQAPPPATRPAWEQDQAAELRRAAWYSERARNAPNAAQRLESYARALEIYTRLGRPHQAVEIGLRYRDFLRSGGSRAAGHGDARWRLRELDLRLGECYLALGHYPTAEE